jgi:hypothetical protein
MVKSRNQLLALADGMTLRFKHGLYRRAALKANQPILKRYTLPQAFTPSGLMTIIGR